jgi:diguanylate cyclase (GGDEF)-like protein
VVNYIFILQNQTTLDPLTGLGNRRAYNEYLANLGKKSNIVLSVVTIDLDEFKKINDIYGHHEGDKVLLAFARELKTVFEGRGVPIRVGGDEFIVFIDENRKEIVEKYIEALIDNINVYNDSLALPYRISFSYGLTIFDNSYSNLQELMQHSDKRMYQDKQQKDAKNPNTHGK